MKNRTGKELFGMSTTLIRKGTIVTTSAQGLMMYFREDEVATLVKAMARRFPGGYFMFDHI